MSTEQPEPLYFNSIPVWFIVNWHKGDLCNYPKTLRFIWRIMTCIDHKVNKLSDSEPWQWPDQVSQADFLGGDGAPLNSGFWQYAGKKGQPACSPFWCFPRRWHNLLSSFEAWVWLNWPRWCASTWSWRRPIPRPSSFSVWTIFMRCSFRTPSPPRGNWSSRWLTGQDYRFDLNGKKPQGAPRDMSYWCKALLHPKRRGILLSCKEGNRWRSLSYVEVDWHSRASKDPARRCNKDWN